MKSFNEFFIALGVVLLGVGLVDGEPRFGRSRVVCPVIFIVVDVGPRRVSSPRKAHGLAEHRARDLASSVVIAGCSLSPTALPTAECAVHQLCLAGSAHRSRTVRWLAMRASWLRFHVRFRFCSLAVAGVRSPRCLAMTRAFHRLARRTLIRCVVLPDRSASSSSRSRMRFDMSDRERLTRRSDFAFWLTCLPRRSSSIRWSSLISSSRET